MREFGLGVAIKAGVEVGVHTHMRHQGMDMLNGGRGLSR